MREKPNFISTMPASIRYNEELSDREKLLFTEVTALCDITGTCWASNEYFSDLYGVSTSSIKRSISNLVKRGYLNREIIYKNNSKEVEKRILTLGANILLPPVQSRTYPGGENEPENKHNTTSTYCNYVDTCNMNVDTSNINNNRNINQFELLEKYFQKKILELQILITGKS